MRRGVVENKRTVTAEPPALETPTPGALRDELRARRAALSRSIGRSLWTGAGLLLISETIVNADSIGRLTALLSPSRSDAPAVKWNLDLGISSPDAVVVATALLVLVATVNVALAALQIGDSPSWRGSVRAYFLWRDAEVIATLASATSLALAATRLANSVGTALLLVLLAIITMIAGRMIGEASGPSDLALQKVVLEEQIANLTAAYKRSLETVHWTPSLRRKGITGSAASIARTTLLAVACSLAVALLVTLASSTFATIPWFQASPVQLLALVAYFLVPLAGFYALISTVSFIPLALAEYARARGWPRRRLLFLLLHAAASVALLILLMTSVEEPFSGPGMLAIAVTFIPAVASLPALRAAGQRWRSSPGHAVALLVPSMIHGQLDEHEKSIASVDAELSRLGPAGIPSAAGRPNDFRAEEP